MSLDSAVTIIALALACLAFGLFWYFTVSQLNSAKQAKASVDNAIVKNEAVAVSDVTRMLESAGSLIDSLAKAGPSLFALAASVLFLAIAALYRHQTRCGFKSRRGRDVNFKLEASFAKAGTGKMAEVDS